MIYNRKKLFDAVRSSFGSLKQTQVDGFETILKAWEYRYPDGDTRFLAYLMATAWHETGYTMQPIREAFGTSTADSIRRLDAAWSKGQLKGVKTPYWRTGFFGRGYVQLTHEDNYRKASQRLKELFGIDEDFVKNPERVMDPEYAFLILAVGSIEGWFAGDKQGQRYTLTRFFNETANDPSGARRIINGIDQADKIAGHYRGFLEAIKASAESGKRLEAPLEPVQTKEPLPAPTVAETPSKATPAPSVAVEIPQESTNLIVKLLLLLRKWLTS